MTDVRAKLIETVRRARSIATLLNYWRRAGTDELVWLTGAIGVEYGHFRSVSEGRSVAPNGQALPWYTYPALEYLGQFDFSKWKAFEFGGGASSSYWAKRCGFVTTVESNAEWFSKVVQTARENQRVIHEADPARYAGAIAEGGEKYDLIVIDGEHRRACAERAVEHLAPSGMIVFDNTDWWPGTTAILRKHGLFEIDFTGPGPINRYIWTTSIFFGPELRLELATGRQPMPGIGSMRQLAIPE